jgi:hypothetical protein
MASEMMRTYESNADAGKPFVMPFGERRQLP